MWKVKIENPGKLPTLDYRKMIPLQGELKEFTPEGKAALKNSIDMKGFIYPFFIWLEEPGRPLIIDGHGRWKLLMEEKASPVKFPYVPIPAESVEDAKERLLAATSQMQRLLQDGLYEFAFGLNVEFLNNATHFTGVFNFKPQTFFTPNYNPESPNPETGKVTQEEMEKVDLKMKQDSAPEILVTCPHCGEDFSIKNGYSAL